jgi:phage-related protein (TIGR01555 family)
MASKATKRKAPAKHPAQPSNILAMDQFLQQIFTQDVFSNLMARTGYGSPSLMEGTTYPLTRLTRNYNLMNALYRNHWIVRRIVKVVPEDMLKNWFQYVSDIKPEEIDLLHKAERITRLRRSLTHGMNWGRLYGGAAGLMLLEGQDELLEEPLDLDAIMPGDFKGILIADRWSGVYPDSELVDNINDPEFGLPKYYMFRSQEKGGEVYKVHHSRIVRFEGYDLPEWERQAETYWGMSVIESVYEELKKRDNTSANIAGLIFLANLRILKMSDLGQALTATPTQVQKDLYNTVQMQNWLQSNFGIYLMDKEDEFQQFTLQNFRGIADVYECFMMDIAGAANIPITRLFGRSPAGLNATGENDMRNYYDFIESEQETYLRPPLEKLGPVLCASALGFIPDDFDVQFNPVYTPNGQELGEITRFKTEAIFGAHDRGLISDQTGMKELKQLADDAGLFSNIMDEDINKASNETGQISLPDMPESGEENEKEEKAPGEDA